jgi:amidase
MKSLEDLIAFNEEHRDREMPFFGQERFLTSQARGPLTDPAYLEAVNTIQRLTRGAGIDALVSQHQLDAIVAPTSGLAWMTDHVLGDRLDGGFSAGPAAIAGYPDITVPMGFLSGLPVGVSFFGPAWSEPKLLAVAYSYEQATRHRKPPELHPTLA